MATSKPKNHPTLQERAAEPICPNCGGEVVRKSRRGRAPVYCKDACRKEMAARDLNRGKALITQAMAWYQSPRGSETWRESFKEMNAILQIFKEQDEKAGRPSADLAGAKALADGTRYMDRMKV